MKQSKRHCKHHWHQLHEMICMLNISVLYTYYSAQSVGIDDEIVTVEIGQEKSITSGLWKWHLKVVFNLNFIAQRACAWQSRIVLICVTNLFTFHLHSGCHMLAGCHAGWSVTDSSVLVVLLLGRYLRLKMFREDHGSWMTMFFSTILLLFIFSHIYNLFLLMAGSME